jgi:chaperonin GroEL
VVVEKVRTSKGNTGYNAMTKEYEDLVKAMVIDPKKVTRTALQNAASVAAMFLTLEVAVTEIPKKEEPMPMPGGMDGMGGMGGF